MNCPEWACHLPVDFRDDQAEGIRHVSRVITSDYERMSRAGHAINGAREGPQKLRGTTLATCTT